jgi:peptidoglycan/LPS O-acetylase OafA/YrhL
LWPALVYLLSGRALRRVCFALILIAPMLRVWMLMMDNQWGAYVFTLCRMDSLAWGALAAIFMYEGMDQAVSLVRGRWVYPLILFGVIAFWPGVGTWQIKTDFTLGMSLLGFAFCGAVLTTVNSRIGWLENRMLRSLGKYSYGIYIWEAKITWGIFPFLAASKFGRPVMGVPYVGVMVFIVGAMVCAYAAGWASYNLMEKHFLVLKRYFEYRPANQKENLPQRTQMATEGIGKFS